MKKPILHSVFRLLSMKNPCSTMKNHDLGDCAKKRSSSAITNDRCIVATWLARLGSAGGSWDGPVAIVIIERVLEPPEKPTVDRPDDALGAVADATAGADQEATGEGETVADLSAAAELAAADADYASGNTVTGEELRHRYGLS